MTDVTIPPSNNSIEKITTEDEMQEFFLDYAMSVLASRALPDVEDVMGKYHPHGDLAIDMIISATHYQLKTRCHGILFWNDDDSC